jgi:hypothetical protein
VAVGGVGWRSKDDRKQKKHDALLLQVYNVDPPPAAAGRGRRRREQAGPDTAARIRSQSSENMIRQEFNPSLSVPIRHNLFQSVTIHNNPLSVSPMLINHNLSQQNQRRGGAKLPKSSIPVQ